VAKSKIKGCLSSKTAACILNQPIMHKAMKINTVTQSTLKKKLR
jgi:hypothetical protein